MKKLIALIILTLFALNMKGQETTPEIEILYGDTLVVEYTFTENFTHKTYTPKKSAKLKNGEIYALKFLDNLNVTYKKKIMEGTVYYLLPNKLVLSYNKEEIMVSLIKSID